MGIMNVLTKHKLAYDAACLMAEHLGVTAEQMALALLARIQEDAGGDYSATLTHQNGQTEVRMVKDVFPVKGDQFVETFDAELTYWLEDYGTDDPYYHTPRWQAVIAGLASRDLECSMDEAVMAAIVFQGMAIVSHAKITLFV